MKLKDRSTGLPVSPARLPERRGPRRLVSALGALAAVLVVGFLVTVLVLSRLQTHPGTPGSGTPTAIGSGTTWVVPQGLAELDGEPVIAPSNPQVLYRITVSDVQSVPVKLFRSQDGGATWQKLAFPSAPGLIGNTFVAVSPLNPQTVVLQLALNADSSGQTCPVARAQNGNSLAAYAPAPSVCYVHFVSVDGGSHWSALTLPQAGASAGAEQLVPLGGMYSASGYLRAQGSRLYAVVGEDTDTNGVLNANGVRLITSTDGGKTWNLADQAIIDQQLVVCDALLVPGSSEVFAIAQAPSCQSSKTQQLWHSTDAGATWNRVGTLPEASEQGMAIASQGSPARPILYIRLASDSAAASDLMASTDGGATWVKAPTQGIPVSLHPLTGPLGTLSDGSVLVAFEAQDTTSQTPFTLYRWKAGDAAWQQVGPSFGGSPDYVLVVDGTLWMVTIHGQGGFTVQRLG